MLAPDGVALRGLFIIDREGVVQHSTINNLSFGRSVDETLRVLQALQYVQSHPDEVCPAGWKPGEARRGAGGGGRHGGGCRVWWAACVCAVCRLAGGPGASPKLCSLQMLLLQSLPCPPNPAPAHPPHHPLQGMPP